MEVKPYKFRSLFAHLSGSGGQNLCVITGSQFQYVDEDTVGFWSMSYVIDV
jgi:hypothetical protein